MMGQGLGPGFTTVATRRSVILSADGLEFVLTFRCAACSAATSRDRSAPPMIPAEVLNRSRRPNLPLLLNIAVFSSQSAGLPQLRLDTYSARIRFLWRFSAIFNPHRPADCLAGADVFLMLRSSSSN